MALPDCVSRRQVLRTLGLGGLWVVGGKLLAACVQETSPTPVTTTTTLAPETTTSTTLPSTTTSPRPVEPFDAPPLRPGVVIPPELPSHPPTLIQGANVFDGETVLGVTSVLLADGLIEALDPGLSSSDVNAQVVNGQGMTLLPGLIDSHIHYWGFEIPVQSLNFGVTTEFDMFSAPDRPRRESELLDGRVDRPDTFSSGILATAPGGHGTQFPELRPPTLSDSSDVPDWVQERVAEGSDYIKIVVERCCGFRPLPGSVVEALVREAHQHGLRAVAHVTSIVDTESALGAGIDGLVHLPAGGRLDRTMLESIAAGTGFVVTTLGILQTSAGKPILQDENVRRYVYPLMLDAFTSDAYALGIFRDYYERGVENLLALADTGVPVLAGSDAANPGTTWGAGVLLELEIMVSVGLDPVWALQSATSRPADVFGLEDRGRIREGLRADVVLVEGDPTTGITSLRNIAGVWKLGHRATRQELG